MDEGKNNKSYVMWIVIAIIVIGLIVYMMSRGKSTEVTPPSETPTTVTPPASTVQLVSVISPNGGETWVRGKQYNIKWNTTGVAATEPVYLDLIKLSSPIDDQYAADPEKIGGYELFHQSIFPKGLAKEGTIAYTVPNTTLPGTYQLLIWAGTNCSVTKTNTKCAFDLSDGLITVK